jgi:hypothetical protein
MSRADGYGGNVKKSIPRGGTTREWPSMLTISRIFSRSATAMIEASAAPGGRGDVSVNLVRCLGFGLPSLAEFREGQVVCRATAAVSDRAAGRGAVFGSADGVAADLVPVGGS